MRLLLIIAILVFPFTSHAQDEYSGPFQQGKFITGLTGSIRSASLSAGLLSADKTRVEGYSIGTRSGKFFKERMAFGLNLFVTRDVQQSAAKIESETLGIGPWWRYYTSNDSRGSVYPEASLLYINFSNEANTTFNNLFLNSNLRGDGIGIDLGVGFTYTISENVGFDLGLNYLASWLSGKTRTTGLEDQKETLYLGQLNFRFGFVVMVNEFFF